MRNTSFFVPGAFGLIPRLLSLATVLVGVATVLLGLAASAQAPPASGSTLIDEGRRHLNAGRYLKAKTAFEQAVAKSPGSAVAHNELGVSIFQGGAPAAAVPSFRKAVDLNPKLAHAWANLGEAQRMAKQYKRAALSFHKYLQLEKGDRFGVYGLALCFEGYESFDKALRTLQVAETAAAADPRLLARVNRAFRRVQLKMGQAKLSFLDRGDAHLAAGRWKEAREMYDRGLKKVKDDPVYLGRRGVVRAIMGDVAGAKLDLRASLLKAHSGEIARAAYILVLDFEKAPEPTPVAGTDNGDGMLAADRAALAWKAFTRAMESATDPAALQLSRGEAALRLGMLDSAEEDFSAASDDPKGSIGRAEVEWVRGNAEEAAAEIDILTVDPQDLPVWRRSLLAD